MLYTVSGYMRSGSSMMMKALETGGMEAVKSEEREQMRLAHKDEHYDPNSGGLYELSPKEYQRWDFPIGLEGKLVKALNMGVPRMAVMPDGIRVVFMRRDPEEIRQSYDAFFNDQLDMTDHDAKMEKITSMIRNRKDVLSCDVFWYREVVDSPLHHFARLKESGWPIDPVAAAKVVDPKLTRYKREELEVGVL